VDNIQDGEELPESWQKAVTIPVHSKGSIKDSENCIGINLLNSGYKIYVSVVKNKCTLITKMNYVKNSMYSEKDSLVVMAVLH
jgi:hypothetical protein